MLFELFTFTSIGAYKPNNWDMTSNSFDEISSENLIELVDVPKEIEMFSIDEGVSITSVINSVTLSMAKLHAKLDSILRLHQGWDGRGAAPVDRKAIDNVKTIANHQCDGWNFKLWQIAPGVNGDVFINYKGKNKLAGIVIGPDTFSYFIEDETLKGESDVPFDSLQVSNLMNSIINA